MDLVQLSILVMLNMLKTVTDVIKSAYEQNNHDAT